MLIVISSLLAGYLIGRLTRRHPINRMSDVINALIWLLLLLMGWEVGSTPNLAASLASLGTDALIITIASTTGSIITAYLLWTVIKRHKQRKCK